MRLNSLFFTPSTRSHHNNLDVLRAIAVLAVIAHHMAVYGQASIPYFGDVGGGFGVQLFFIISGYLIVQSAERNHLSTYCKARFFRIFPAYWVALLSVTILESMTNPALQFAFKNYFLHFILNLLNLQQLSLISNSFFDRIHIGWTLTVELFWYVLVLGLVMMYKIYQRRFFWLLALGASVLLSLFWITIADKGDLDQLFASEAIRGNITWSLGLRHVLIKSTIIGYLYFFVLGAVIYHYQEYLLRLPSVFLCAVVFFSLAYWNEWQIKTGFAPQPISALGLGAIVVLALKIPVVQDRFINYIGKISYSIYLLHAKIMIIIYFSFKWTGFFAHITILLIILLLASLLYRWVEEPMIQFGKRWNSNSNPNPN